MPSVPAPQSRRREGAKARRPDWTSIVVAAAVVERDDAFLLTRRLKGTHLEGTWEFPGGKCEPDETPEACLVREIREELAVDATLGELLLVTRHAYPERTVELHFFRADVAGAPVPQLGQQMRWVPRAELEDAGTPRGGWRTDPVAHSGVNNFAISAKYSSSLIVRPSAIQSSSLMRARAAMTTLASAPAG